MSSMVVHYTMVVHVCDIDEARLARIHAHTLWARELQVASATDPLAQAAP